MQLIPVKRAYRIFYLLLACAGGFPVGAQPLHLDPAVRMGRLANGFTYFIRVNREPLHRVVFYLANKVGSLQEDDDQRGLAHFMEHMSFNGTRHYPKNELVDYLQRSGVRFGADLNAYTNFTETVYELPLPSDDSSLLRHGLEIMRDWAAEASLDPGEIDAERGVVLEEKRMHNGAGQRLNEQVFPLLVNGTRYADRVPIGKEDILRHFKPAVIRRFYKDWYRPDLQALIVVGDIDADGMEGRIRQLFGDLRNPAAERPRIVYRIPLTGRSGFRALTDPEQTSTEIEVLINSSGSTLNTRQAYRKQICQNLLNQVLAERFRELAQAPEPAFTAVQAGVGGYMGGLDELQVKIGVKPGRTEEAFEQAWRELVRMREFGVTAREFERARTIFLTSLENAYAERDKTPSLVYTRQYLNYFLDSTASPGIARELELARELLPEITIDSVHAYARSVIKDKDRDVLVYAPEKDKDVLPDERQVNSWIGKIEEEKLHPPVEQAVAGALPDVVPVGGHVVRRERIDPLGVTVLYLQNGVRVLLKPTDFKEDQVLFTAFGTGGSSAYPDSLYLSASNAARLMAAGGVGAFSAVELAKKLSGKTVRVTPYIQERYSGISGAMAAKDGETALQLIYLYCTAPRVDTLVFRNVIDRARAALAGRSSSPEAVFADSVNLILGGYHFRSRPLTPARLDSISLTDAYAVYRALFAGAGHFTFVFTGSLDTVRWIPWIEKYLGALPVPAAVAGRPGADFDAGPHIPEGRIVRKFYDGNDNRATVQLYYSGKFAYGDTNNLQLRALGTILQYRMIDRIREAEGGAYSPKAGVELTKRPEERYVFSIRFTCAPENVDKLVAAVADEIARLKRDGPSAGDIQKFKAEQSRALELQLRSNGFWQQYLVGSLEDGEPLTDILGYTNRLKTVNEQMVQRAAGLYLSDKNYIQLVLQSAQR